MGGTFDPIHNAHLLAASEVFEAVNLDRVLFIPAGNPWQKSHLPISAAEHRLKMVNLAIAEDSRFSSSDIEVNRAGETYAIDTVLELKQKNPENSYFWIIGADALANMKTWHRFDELKNLIEIVAVNRNNISQVKTDFDYTFVQIPEFQISATQIRNRIRSGASVKYLVTDEVENYIKTSGLYQK